MTGTVQSQMSGQMQTCIENCQDCHTLCIQTAQYCLTLGGKHASADHIRVLLDCADACQTCFNFMSRMSPYHPKYCGNCADLCRACTDSCRGLAGGDQLMLQ